jgi:hypothetical protein
MAFLTFGGISAAGIPSTLAVSLILRTGAVDETPDVEEAFIYFFAADWLCSADISWTLYFIRSV